MQTPFSFGKIVSLPDFTDREKEFTWLKSQVEAKNNCMIISPRRWGKSSLVQYAAKKIRTKDKQKLFVFIDLYNIRTEQEFYEVFSKELLKAGSSGVEEMLRSVKTFFKKLVPKISVSPDPSVDLEVSFNWEELRKDPSEVLNLPELMCRKLNKNIIICLDEFQNISFFDEPLAFQKRLRAHWQKHKETVYCLYGSKRHLLMDFFTSPSMPFYKFGDILFLEKIPEDYWVPFIMERFSATGKKISAVGARKITLAMDRHPYFVQQLSQASWLRSPKTCNDEIIDQTISDLLDQYTILYQREVEQLTNTQLNYLGALLDGVSQLSSNKNLKTYKLGTSANVIRIKTALENKEIIDYTGSEIEFNDPLFKLWLQKRYFK